jgi:acetyl-CoA carboxylase carboxyltransferase component
MINLINALLDYAKKQKLSNEEALTLYQKLNSDVIQSPGLEDACGRVMENFCSALTAFMPQALEQKYGKQITVIKLAADEYTEGLKQHLKELPQKLGSIELDGLAKEAALVYFQKTFEACKEEAIPKEDQKALLKYALKMKANAEFKFSTKFLLTILENPKEILGILPDSREKPYDMMEIIERLVDDSAFEPYKEKYGQSIVCGLARIDGWAVGIVAKQRKVVKSKKGEMQFGGVIYSDSADKAARFIMNCNQKKIPLLFLQDVTGFMVGSRSEQGGIIKDGAKMVNAMANSVVPKFTVVLGNSYGAGNYAMCGKAYDPRLMLAWPTAQIAVMGGAQAAKVLLQIEVSALKAKGKEINAEDEKALYDKIFNHYEQTTSIYYSAARLVVDAIIDPMETRKAISMGIEAANHAPIEKRYNTGVLQV